MQEGDIEIINEGIGAGATATATATRTNTLTVDRLLDSGVDITLDAEINTGGNVADGNAGGDVTIETGDAEITIASNVRANTRPPSSTSGGPVGGSGGGSVGGSSVGGGGVVTAAAVAAPGPTPTPTPSIATSPTAKVAETITTIKPREGIGGGFFPAGNNWLGTLILFLMMSFGFFYAPEITALLKRPIGQPLAS
jgi:hypothetical protein